MYNTLVLNIYWISCSGCCYCTYQCCFFYRFYSMSCICGWEWIFRYNEHFSVIPSTSKMCNFSWNSMSQNRHSFNYHTLLLCTSLIAPFRPGDVIRIRILTQFIISIYLNLFQPQYGKGYLLLITGAEKTETRTGRWRWTGTHPQWYNRNTRSTKKETGYMSH